MPKINTSRKSYWTHYPYNCQLGLHERRMGFRDQVYTNIYSLIGIRKEFIWNSIEDDHSISSRRANNFNSPDGGIFNLEFSPNGSLLVAATEKKNLLLFDALNQRLEKRLKDAHDDSVNFVKFLDSRVFATCSDDRTIALWDLRKLSSKLRSFRGHNGWVKNIEYESNKGLLVTSGYDECVNVWDINKFRNSDSEIICERALRVSSLLRMRLTHDGTKMIVGTSDGYLMVIHDLDLSTLATDLGDFPVDHYRMMQQNFSCGFDMGSWFNNLFTARRNRVELISDFPRDNRKGQISSVQIHPYNWCVLSRNTSRNEFSEWTCVHDIQDWVKPNEFMEIYRTDDARSRQRQESDQFQAEVQVSATGNRPSSSSYNHQLIIISCQIGSGSARTTILEPSRDYREIAHGSVSRVYKNLPRLTHYIKEANVKPGFIKELCFSSDGRVICSPYEFGYRLLTFNPQCKELCDCDETEFPKELTEVKKILTHPDYVLVTKFNPVHCQIASGCLTGRVCFSQPIL